MNKLVWERKREWQFIIRTSEGETAALEHNVGNCFFLSVIVNKMEVLFYRTAGEVLSEISL